MATSYRLPPSRNEQQHLNVVSLEVLKRHRVANVFMPWAISFVATSKKAWLNLVIAYGSSAIVGALTAYVGGQFTHAVWPSILAGITAAQLAYHVYWSPKKIAAETVVQVNQVPLPPADGSSI